VKRHKWLWHGRYSGSGDMKALVWGPARIRNWPCGACGLWRRAKVHR